MFNHAPSDYICPLCLAIKGIEGDKTMMKQADIIYKDDLVMGAINSKFVGNNPGHVIVVPVKHYENFYDLPETEVNRIMKIARQIAIAMKEIRKCDGVMLQQNNEPASGQHAFHYHLHIFPRFENDDFINAQKNVHVATYEERKIHSDAFKIYFQNSPIKL